jgi:hypothetical protein
MGRSLKTSDSDRTPRSSDARRAARTGHRAERSEGPATVAARFPELEQFDWLAFVCQGCGQETFIGREPTQSIEDFALMCEWLYGDPPSCTNCLRPDGEYALP